MANHGWQWDNNGSPIFYSAQRSDGSVMDGAISVYRLYNGGLSAHHYTLDQSENDSLIANSGWSGEGVDFYAYKNAF